METSKRLHDIVPRVLRAVRSFGKVDGDNLASAVQFIREYLANRNEGEILISTVELQAVSLLFDYEDSRGGPFTPTVQKVGEAILRNRTSRIKEIFQGPFPDASARTKWMRQVVWVLLAHSLWLHRHNNLRKMSVVLNSAKALLDDYLLPESKRPGTLARWHYYMGLQLRDQGELERAMEHFGDSFAHAQERRSAKGTQSDDESPVDSAVEEAFSRACLARIQAFGFGEVSFFRGDLAGSSAWFRTALRTLEGGGLERWKLSVSVYLDGSRILISPLTTEGSQCIEDAQKSLDKLAELLEKRHRGYAELARAFSNLGLLRLEQLRVLARDPESDALQVDLSPQIQATVLHSKAATHEYEATPITPMGPHGAVSALISLINGEMLLRCKQADDCNEEIRRIRKEFALSAFAQVEADLLEAQLWIVEKEWKKAARVLEKDRNLDYRANHHQRAFWFALASTAQLALKNSLSARIFAHRARSVGSRVGHGFIRHFVDVAVSRALRESTLILPMPYQEEPPNLSLEDNLQCSIRNLIETALNRNESIKSAEELAPVLHLSKTAIYERIDKKLLELFFKRRLNIGA